MLQDMVASLKSQSDEFKASMDQRMTKVEENINKGISHYLSGNVPEAVEKAEGKSGRVNGSAAKTSDLIKVIDGSEPVDYLRQDVRNVVKSSSSIIDVLGEAMVERLRITDFVSLLQKTVQGMEGRVEMIAKQQNDQLLKYSYLQETLMQREQAILDQNGVITNLKGELNEMEKQNLKLLSANRVAHEKLLNLANERTNQFNEEIESSKMKLLTTEEVVKNLETLVREQQVELSNAEKGNLKLSNNIRQLNDEAATHEVKLKALAEEKAKLETQKSVLSLKVQELHDDVSRLQQLSESNLKAHGNREEAINNELMAVKTNLEALESKHRVALLEVGHAKKDRDDLLGAITALQDDNGALKTEKLELKKEITVLLEQVKVVADENHNLKLEQDQLLASTALQNDHTINDLQREWVEKSKVADLRIERLTNDCHTVKRENEVLLDKIKSAETSLSALFVENTALEKARRELEAQVTKLADTVKIYENSETKMKEVLAAQTVLRLEKQSADQSNVELLEKLQLKSNEVRELEKKCSDFHNTFQALMDGKMSQEKVINELKTELQLVKSASKGKENQDTAYESMMKAKDDDISYLQSQLQSLVAAKNNLYTDLKDAQSLLVQKDFELKELRSSSHAGDESRSTVGSPPPPVTPKPDRSRVVLSPSSPSPVSTSTVVPGTQSSPSAPGDKVSNEAGLSVTIPPPPPPLAKSSSASSSPLASTATPTRRLSAETVGTLLQGVKPPKSRDPSPSPPDSGAKFDSSEAPKKSLVPPPPSSPPPEKHRSTLPSSSPPAVSNTTITATAALQMKDPQPPTTQKLEEARGVSVSTESNKVVPPPPTSPMPDKVRVSLSPPPVAPVLSPAPLPGALPHPTITAPTTVVSESTMATAAVVNDDSDTSKEEDDSQLVVSFMSKYLKQKKKSSDDNEDALQLESVIDDSYFTTTMKRDDAEESKTSIVPGAPKAKVVSDIPVMAHDVSLTQDSNSNANVSSDNSFLSEPESNGIGGMLGKSASISSPDKGESEKKGELSAKDRLRARLAGAPSTSPRESPSPPMPSSAATSSSPSPAKIGPPISPPPAKGRQNIAPPAKPPVVAVTEGGEKGVDGSFSPAVSPISSAKSPTSETDEERKKRLNEELGFSDVEGEIDDDSLSFLST